MEDIIIQTHRSKRTINIQNPMKVLDSDDKFSNIETLNPLMNFQNSQSPDNKQFETNQSLLENYSILNQLKGVDAKEETKNEEIPKKQTKQSYQRYYLKTSNPDPPSALVGLLEQQYKYDGDILFKSLHDMTQQLTFKLKQFQEKGEIIIKEIDDNPLECNIGMLVVEKMNKQKQLKKWDGNGGAAGLSQWLIYEAINISKKSPEWIKNFVDSVTVAKMKSILTIHYGEDQHHLEMEKDAVPEGDDIELEQVLFDGEINDNFNDDSQSLFQETKDQRKNEKNVIQHFQLNSFTNKLNNYHVNTKIYKKCASKNIKKPLSRNKSENKQIQSLKYPDLQKCHTNQLCEINKMTILQDHLSTMPLPLPYGSYNKQQREQNLKYCSNPNFQQRNMLVDPREHVIQDYKGKVQQGSIRVIATEEALDKWHAISLSIPLEKYLKQKKMYKQYSKASEPQSLVNLRKNKLMESIKTSTNNNQDHSDSEQQDQNKQKNIQPTLQLNRETYQDFNHFIQMEKKNQKPQIVTRKDLKVTAFSKFQNKQSEVILRTGGYNTQHSAWHKKNKSEDLRKDDNTSASNNDKFQSDHQSNRKSLENKQEKKENVQKQVQIINVPSQKLKERKIPKKQQPSDQGKFKSQLIAKLFNKQSELLKNKKISSNDIFNKNQNESSYPFRQLINKTDIPIFVQQKMEIEKLLDENQEINKQLQQKIKYNSTTAIKKPEKNNNALKLQNFKILQQSSNQIPIKLINQQLHDILNQQASIQSFKKQGEKKLPLKNNFLSKQMSVQNITQESRFKNITLTNDNSSTNVTQEAANNLSHRIQSEEQFKFRLSTQKKVGQHPLTYTSLKEQNTKNSRSKLFEREKYKAGLQLNTRANTSKARQANQQSNLMNIDNNEYSLEDTNRTNELSKTSKIKIKSEHINNEEMDGGSGNKQNLNKTSLQVSKTRYLLKNKFFIQDSQLKNETSDSLSGSDQKKFNGSQIKIEDSFDFSSNQQKNNKTNLNINISKKADCSNSSNRMIQQSQNTNKKISVQVLDEQFYDDMIQEVLEFGQPMQYVQNFNIFEKNRQENYQFQIKNGGYRTSQNEELFYFVNNQVKGKSVTTNSQKNLLSFCQTQYFQDFKQDTKQNICQSYVKVNRYKDQINQNNNKKDIQNQQYQKHHRRQSSIGVIIELPMNEQLKMKVIVDELQADNIQDTESHFTNFEVNQQVNYVELQTRDLKPKENLRNRKYDFNSEQFWFLKAYDHFKSNNNDELKSAVDCFVQTIKSNPLNICAIHNLACAYETQQRYQLAIKWFDIAIKLDPDNKEYLDTYYSLALAYFKSGKPQEAVYVLDKAISMLENIEITQRAHYDKYYFRYLRALCHRALMKFKESEQDYGDIIKIFQLEEGKQISSIIISMILMPLEQNRKKLQKLLEQFKGIIEKYEIPQNRKLLSHYYVEIAEKLQIYIGKNKHPVWIDKHIWTVLKILKKLSFFKRFNIKRIKEIMDNMKLQLISPKKILFFESNKVYVLVTGSILMQCHQKKPDCPVTLAKFQPGSIMNFMQDDSKIFNSIETWFLAQVETEVAVFEKKYFQKIWNEDIMTQELMFKKNIVTSYQVFKSLSEIVLMSLVSEYIQIKNFKKDEVIIKQSKYAPSCPEHREFLKMQAQQQSENIRQKVVYNKKGSTEKASFFKSIANYAIQANQTEKISRSQNQSSIIKNDPVMIKQEEKSVFNESEIQINSDRNKIEKLSETITNGGDLENKSNQPSTSLAQDQIQIDEIFNSEIFQKSNDGIYIITKGRCQVIQKSDQYKACYLQGGEFFGESEILKVIGYDYFGDIVAESEDIECMFISQDDLFKIPYYELVEIKNFAEKRQSLKLLAYQYSKRYNIEQKEYLSYFN